MAHCTDSEIFPQSLDYIHDSLWVWEYNESLNLYVKYRTKNLLDYKQNRTKRLNNKISAKERAKGLCIENF